MEYLDLAVKDIVFTNETIELTYENDAKEVVQKRREGYKDLYNAWLKENPMFISDKFKTQIRDLTYASNGNETNLNEINNEFFDDGIPIFDIITLLLLVVP